jgi:hypothetical protein
MGFIDASAASAICQSFIVVGSSFVILKTLQLNINHRADNKNGLFHIIMLCTILEGVFFYSIMLFLGKLRRKT